jgi:hypothetical protein
MLNFKSIFLIAASNERGHMNIKDYKISLSNDFPGQRSHLCRPKRLIWHFGIPTPALEFFREFELDEVEVTYYLFNWKR